MGKQRKKYKTREPSSRQKKAFKILAEKGGNLGDAFGQAGFSKVVQETPTKVTKTQSWQALMKKFIPDTLVARKHNELLNSSRLEHMTFPLGPDPDAEKKEDIPEAELEAQPHGGALLRKHNVEERTKLTDNEISQLLASVNCTVQRIVHADTCRHVYFWSADNKARQAAIDMAYKLKNRYSAESPDVKVDNHFHFAKDPRDATSKLGKNSKTGGGVEIFNG